METTKDFYVCIFACSTNNTYHQHISSKKLQVKSAVWRFKKRGVGAKENDILIKAVFSWLFIQQIYAQKLKPPDIFEPKRLTYLCYKKFTLMYMNSTDPVALLCFVIV